MQVKERDQIRLLLPEIRQANEKTGKVNQPKGTNPDQVL